MCPAPSPPPPVYRCFGGFGSGVCSVWWDTAFEGEGIGVVWDGFGGWVSTGSPCGVELPAVGGVGAVVSRGANRGLVGWKAGV